MFPAYFAYSFSSCINPRESKKPRPIDLSFLLWQELGDGNITFSDELDFELIGLDLIYEDSGIAEK